MSQVLSRTPAGINGFACRRPRFGAVLCALVLVSLLALLFVWSRIHAINLEYDISRLERSIRACQKQNKELETEATFLARDERVEMLARTYLGLRPAVPGQIIRVE